MSLKDTEIRALKPREKNYRKADGGGLYIEVFPNDSKLWRWKFRVAGKEKRLALGAYPAVSLRDARLKRDEEKAKLSSGLDPALERKRCKVAAKISAANTFSSVAREYIETKMVAESRAKTTISKAHWFLEQLEPAIGNMPVAEVDQQMLLAALMRVQMRGRFETTKKCRSFASRVFRFAAATGRCGSDPAHLLKGALTTPKAKHYAAILEPTKLGELLRAIEVFSGGPVTKAALQIAPHVFVRPGELRHAEWEEFDFDAAIWNLPAGKMKARRPHSVPLSQQVQAMLLELHELTGSGKYVFPSAYGHSRPMSENTLNASFRRMGFDKDEVTAHGLRATASTLLNQSGLWNPDAIERALAHGESNATRGAYLQDYQGIERPLSYWFSLRQIETDGRTSDHVPFVEPDQNSCCIPTDFWRAYRHTAAESQADWLSGDFYIDHCVDASGSWSGFARSVHFNRSALPGSELAPRHINGLAPSKANHSERSTNTGGAPTKYDWPRAIAHVVALAETDGIDPEGREQETNVSHVARLMEHWFDSQGADVPGGSQLRRYAGMIVAAIHQHRAERQLKTK